MEMCEACQRDDHEFCAMTWCECTDVRDGLATKEEFVAYHNAKNRETP